MVGLSGLFLCLSSSAQGTTTELHTALCPVLGQACWSQELRTQQGPYSHPPGDVVAITVLTVLSPSLPLLVSGH